MTKKASLIGGVVVAKGLEILVGKALEQVASRGWNGLKPEEVPAATQVVVKEIGTELSAMERHSTNNEPFYKSRVTLGSLMAVMGAVVGMYTLGTDGQPEVWEQWSPHVMVVGGALFALYGRFVAKKPLGE